MKLMFHIIWSAIVYTLKQCKSVQIEKCPLDEGNNKLFLPNFGGMCVLPRFAKKRLRQKMIKNRKC